MTIELIYQDIKSKKMEFKRLELTLPEAEIGNRNQNQYDY